jgi:hypothetical protein
VEAIETLVTLMRNSPDDRVRLLAADKLLERGFGKVKEYDPERDVGKEGLAARLEAARQRLFKGSASGQPQVIEAKPIEANPQRD